MIARQRTLLAGKGGNPTPHAKPALPPACTIIRVNDGSIMPRPSALMNGEQEDSCAPLRSERHESSVSLWMRRNKTGSCLTQ